MYALDDTAPFQDYSGYNRTGTTVSGTPVTSVSLAAGAVFSQVFDRNVVGKFATPVFNQGKESDPFTLETWLYPISKIPSQPLVPYRENLAPNSSADYGTQNWAAFSGTGGTVVTTRGTSGGAHGPSFIRGTWSVASTSSGDISYILLPDVLFPGEVFSWSIWVRANTARAFLPGIQWQNADGSANATFTTTATGTIPANTWTKIGMDNITIPAGITRFKVMARTITNMSATDIMDVDSVLIERGPVAGPYIESTSTDQLFGTAQPYRENLFPNPSVENGTFAINSTTSQATISSASDTATGWPVSGTKSLKMVGVTVGGSGAARQNYADRVAATEGDVFSASAIFRNITGISRNCFVYIRFYDALPTDSSPGTALATAIPGSTALANNEIKLVKNENAIAPAGTKSVGILFVWNTIAAAGETIYVDGVMLNKGPTVNPFFDGQMAGYEWSGTANASVSKSRTDVARVNIAVPNALAPLDAVNFTLQPGVSYQGSTWTRATWNGTGNNVLRQRVNLSSLSTLQPYTATVTVANDGVSPVTVQMDWVDLAVASVILQPGETRKISTTATRTYDSTYRFSDLSLPAAGNFLLKDFIIEKGNASRPFFDGNSPGAIWNGTSGQSESLLLASSAEQQALSHSGIYDGLSVNGTKVSFTTKYADTTEARATHDLQQIKRVHLVGVHTADKNSLYVDGELVDEVDITETQQLSTYVATSPDLYSGTSLSSQAVALNGVTVYDYALPPESIATNYEAGRGETDIAERTDGEPLYANVDNSNVFLDQTWATTEDWQGGVFFNTAVVDEKLVPLFTDDVSIAGQWYTSFDLEASNATSIYGVNFNWDGAGAVIAASLDGTTWETVQRGINLNIIPSGFNPTDKVLQIRVTFAGGITDDPSYLDSFNVVGFSTNTSIEQAGRTLTYASVHPEREFDPMELHDDWGAFVAMNGSLTISADAVEGTVARTVELWIKRTADNPTISATGTFYQNGAVSTSTLVAGQWTLMHIVAPADITGSITITGPVQIGHVAIYETALTATEVANVYAAYTGTNQVKTIDSSTVSLTEPAASAQIYAHDWSIAGAG